MKKRFFICIAFCAMFFSCVSTDGGNSTDGISLEEAIEQSARELAAKLPKKTRVAIIAFTSEHENLSNYVMDELTGALIGASLEVADRHNLAFVYKELGFQMSGDVSDKTAEAIGNFLGAQYVISGQLVKAGENYRYRLSGINVKTAIQESSTRLTIRNDRTLRALLTDLQKTPIVVTNAGYGEHPTTAPRSAGSFLDRGILFATRGDYELAIADFTEAINLDDALVSAYILRGRALRASVSYVTRVEDKFESFISIGRSRNVSHEEQSILDKATIDFTQAIRLDPNNAKAYRSRGSTYSDKGDNDRAIADYNQAIKLDPNDAKAYSNRGNVYSDKGDNDRAIADFNQAIKLDPNDALAYNNRGNAYSDKGNKDRAIADFNQAIKLDLNYALAYNNRGNAYLDKGDNDRAIADFNQAIKLDPNYASAYYNRGIAYYKTGDNDKAIANYNQALKLDANFALAYLNRGIAYWAKGDNDKAIADYNQALKLDTNFALAYLNRGNAYSAKGDKDRAIADYNQAIRLDPNYAKAYLNRGIAYYNKRDYARARADWTKALQINPNLTEARNNLKLLE